MSIFIEANPFASLLISSSGSPAFIQPAKLTCDDFSVLENHLFPSRARTVWKHITGVHAHVCTQAHVCTHHVHTHMHNTCAHGRTHHSCMGTCVHEHTLITVYTYTCAHEHTHTSQVYMHTCMHSTCAFRHTHHRCTCTHSCTTCVHAGHIQHSVHA